MHPKAKTLAHGAKPHAKPHGKAHGKRPSKSRVHRLRQKPKPLPPKKVPGDSEVEMEDEEEELKDNTAVMGLHQSKDIDEKIKEFDLSEQEQKRSGRIKTTEKTISSTEEDLEKAKLTDKLNESTTKHPKRKSNKCIQVDKC